MVYGKALPLMRSFTIYLPSNPPHGVNELHHNLNFFCKYPTKTKGLVESGVQATMRGMTLQEYFSTEPRGAKIEMARHLGISVEWMSKMISGKAVISAALALKVEQATQGLVLRKDLRPDLFG